MSTDAANLPARRIRIALDLFDLAEAMLRQRLRLAQPLASETEIEAAVAAWRTERPGAEHGDAPGKPRSWPLG